MANLNNDQSGVFGGVNMEGNVDYTSYFDNLNQNVENVQTNDAGIFENNQSNYYSNSYNGSNNEFEANSETSNVANKDSKIFQPIGQEKAITKQGLWTKIRSFLFQEIDLNAPIKVELTPYQQKIEDEINEFLHQEVTFKGIFNIFGKK